MQAQANISEASQKRLFEHQTNLEMMKEAFRERFQKPNGDQFKAAGFAKRTLDAENIFSNLSNDGYDRTSLATSVNSALPNRMMTKENQMQDQAERNFVNAVLRRESGAAIAKSEFESAEKQYFPRSGDSPEVIAQKKANREAVIRTLVGESGPAFSKVTGIQIPGLSPDPLAQQMSGGGGGGGANGAPAWMSFIKR
jgi:hypothetical protein